MPIDVAITVRHGTSRKVDEGRHHEKGKRDRVNEETFLYGFLATPRTITRMGLKIFAGNNEN
jgi:hypothetical protein